MSERQIAQAVISKASRAERVLFALSAAGVPIGIFALRRLGRFGGLLLEVAGGALGVRAGVMLAMGATRQLQVAPRLLLFVETGLDGLAMVAGFGAWVWQPFVRPALAKRAGARVARRWRRRAHLARKSSGATWVTPIAIAAWMAALLIHTARMAIYISPSRGLRARTADAAQSARARDGEADVRPAPANVMRV